MLHNMTQLLNFVNKCKYVPCYWDSVKLGDLSFYIYCPSTNTLGTEMDPQGKTGGWIYAEARRSWCNVIESDSQKISHTREQQQLTTLAQDRKEWRTLVSACHQEPLCRVPAVTIYLLPMKGQPALNSSSSSFYFIWDDNE